MKEEDLDALVKYRMDRSKEALKAAKIMFENGMLISSMNRIYFSMFYAVQALLVLKGVAFSKHGQVKGYFNAMFIKKNLNLLSL